jgi:hypothetical protein
MSDDIAPSQERALLRLLDQVLEVMRDDRPFNPDDPAFGTLESAEFHVPGGGGKKYVFTNRAFPEVRMNLSTRPDPLDYLDDSWKCESCRFPLNYGSMTRLPALVAACLSSVLILQPTG